MFKFNNLSKSDTVEEEKFKIEDYKLTFDEFLEKRKTSKKHYVFDLRTTEEYEMGHLPGCHSLPSEYFENSIYQMPYEGDILLYGSGNQEGQRAAEILYENGFDTFHYIDSFQELMEHLAQSPFTVSEAAQKQFKTRLSEEGALKGFRIKAAPVSSQRAKFSLDFVQEAASNDVLIEKDGVSFYADSESLLYLKGTIIDYDSSSDVVSIENPEMAVPAPDGTEHGKMEQLLEDQINPMVAGHGGFVNLLEVKGSRVVIEFGGGCQGCGMSQQTLKQGVEVVIMENIPSITEVLDTTDHASGTNPYFQG